MNNLTLERKLVVYAKGIDPVPGHYLVLYKKVGAGGKTFHSCLAPGEKLKKLLLFRSPDSFIAYAVPDDENLRHRFSRDYKSRDQVHSFTLNFILELHVYDPQNLVERHESDPLRRIEEEIDTIVTQEARDLDWREVKRGGRDFQETLFPTLATNAADNLGRVRRFARNLGIEVCSVAVDRQLPETEIQEEIKIKEHRTNKLDQELRFDIENNEKNFERNQQIGDQVAKGVTGALDREYGKLQSIDDIDEAMRKTRKLEGRPTVGPALPPAGAREEMSSLPAHAAPRPASANGSMAALLVEVSERLDVSEGELPRSRELLSHALHLIAEAARGEAADAATVERHTEGLSQLFAELLADGRLVQGQVTLLSRLQNVEALRRELSRKDGADAGA